MHQLPRLFRAYRYKRSPVLVCALCGGANPMSRMFISPYCSLFCANEVAKARASAAGPLRAAIKSGQIQKAGTFKCVDCGADAHDYDHRAYLDPLGVDPVCRSCNLKRGVASDVAEVVRRLHGSSLPIYALMTNLKRKSAGSRREVC